MKSTLKWSLMLSSLALTGAVAIADAPPPPPPPANPRPADGRGPGSDRPKMSPEERRQQMEDNLREMMTRNGVTDAATQDSVVAFLSNEMQTRQPLRQMGEKLQRALGDQSVTDDQIKAMIADYQNAQDLEKQNRAKAQSDLDAKIHYSQNPRLQGLLMLMGVLGDGPPLMGGPRGPNQRDDKDRPNPRGDRGGNPEMQKRMMEMFDKNKDGQLDDQEKAAMQAYMQQRRGGNKAGNQGAPPPPNDGQMNNDN